MTRASGQQQGIQSVEVAMRALEALERLGGPASLSTIANEAGMTPSSAHRYLVSLTRVGLVAQDSSTGWYDLGAAARRLGLEAIRRVDDIGIATGHAAALRNSTGHAVNISVWSEAGPTIVRWEYGRYPLPIIARVGSILPLVDSSAGRVFLTFLPESITMPVLHAQQSLGESTSPSATEMHMLLRAIRREGLAETVGGVLPGLVALAAPVFGPGGALALTFTCTMPPRTLTPAAIKAVTTELRTACDRLSTELGGPVHASLDG